MKGKEKRAKSFLKTKTGNINSQVTTSRTLEMLRSAMGPVIGATLDDKRVIEIMVNPDGKLWLDRHGEGQVFTGEIITP